MKVLIVFGAEAVENLSLCFFAYLSFSTYLPLNPFHHPSILFNAIFF
jgi:hypothetical protein